MRAWQQLWGESILQWYSHLCANYMDEHLLLRLLERCAPQSGDGGFPAVVALQVWLWALSRGCRGCTRAQSLTILAVTPLGIDSFEEHP